MKLFISTSSLMGTLLEKWFFNGSSEWSKVPPSPFAIWIRLRDLQTLLSCEEP